MSTVIGTVTLDNDMIFEDEFKYSRVSASATRTIGGGVVVQEFEIPEVGRMVTLVGNGALGSQKKSTVEALIALAETPYATYTLTIVTNSRFFSRTVRFVNEIDGGSVQFEPVVARAGLHATTMYYTGTIYLMIV